MSYREYSFTVKSVLQGLKFRCIDCSLDYAYCKLKYNVNPSSKTELGEKKQLFNDLLIS